MSSSFWRLTVRSNFSAAHALRAYHGKCENLHGHNYTVEMTADGSQLTEDTEFIADFSVLKSMLNQELEKLDHKNLNELEPFTSINPTSENIACYLFKRLKKAMASFPAELYSVTVWETDKQSATYIEPNSFSSI